MLKKINSRKYILKETVTKEEAPANSVAGGGVDMAPNAKGTKVFMKRNKLDGRTKEYREAARRIKERKDKLHQREVEAKLSQFGISAMESTTMENNNKYLETKPGSIEDAVLNALNPNAERETLTLPKTDEEDIVEYINSDGSRRRCSGGDGRRVENKAKPKNKKEIEETEVTEGSKEEYEKFFQAALKKFGAKSPAEMDDDKKKKFFNYIEKNWTKDEQKDLTTKIKEGRVSFRIFRENSKENVNEAVTGYFDSDDSNWMKKSTKKHGIKAKINQRNVNPGSDEWKLVAKDEKTLWKWYQDGYSSDPDIRDFRDTHLEQRENSKKVNEAVKGYFDASDPKKMKKDLAKYRLKGKIKHKDVNPGWDEWEVTGKSVEDVWKWYTQSGYGDKGDFDDMDDFKDTHFEQREIDELSTDLLTRYKKKAAAQSSAAAKAGDHKKSHKRYKGVNTATTLQFRNDAKK